MMQVVPRWKVVVQMPNAPSQTFWMNENFVQNVLRKVADMQFTENGLTQPTTITITAA